MKPFTDAELLEFGPDLGAYLATLSIKEQKIFRVGLTIGVKRKQEETYTKGYDDGAADERAQGRLEAIKEGLNTWQNILTGQGAAAKAQPPDFIATMGFTEADIDAVYKRRAKTLHPDVGGTHEGMLELNKAREAALQEIAHGSKGKSTRRRH